MIGTFLDLFLNMDKYLGTLIGQHTALAYAVLFAVIFIETGLVVIPFLPGDSLIFMTAALIAVGAPLLLPAVLILFFAAAILGDTLNYQIGRLLHDRVERGDHILFVKQKNIERTQRFFERHGGKTITIARFVPIIRTFAPFVAGVGAMSYRRFLSYNIVGGVSWVSAMFAIGYFFGNVPYIKAHFSLIVVGIVITSVIPAAAVFLKGRLGSVQSA